MEITTQDHGLIRSLVRYVTAGEGIHEPSPADRLMGLLGVEVKWDRDEQGNLQIGQEGSNPIHTFCTVHATHLDESTQTRFVIYPYSYQLGMTVERELPVQEFSSPFEIIAHIKELAQEQLQGLEMDEEAMEGWGKALLYYAPKGHGQWEPSIGDQLLGMQKVQVVWPKGEDDDIIYETSGDGGIRFVLGIAFESTENKGAVEFRVQAYGIEHD